MNQKAAPIMTPKAQGDLERILLWAEAQGAHVEDSAFGKTIILPGYHCYLLVNPETERIELTLKLDVPLKQLRTVPTPRGECLDVLRWLVQKHPIA